MTTTQIPRAEVEYHPLSFVDPSGRLFWWKQQLYRGIGKDRAALYRGLFADGTISGLINKKLVVETEISPCGFEPYDLVLKHRTIPFVSYAFEWSGKMLQDAALCCLDLLNELARHDLTLQDAHPWNMLFDGCHPCYVDFGSIKPSPANQPWEAHAEFLRTFFYPLQLMAAGHSRAARALLFDWDRSVLPEEWAGLTGAPLSQAGEELPKKSSPFRWWLARKLIRREAKFVEKQLAAKGPAKSPLPDPNSFPNRAAYADAMRAQVESVALPKPKTEWSNYYDATFPPFVPDSTWLAKHRTTHQVLTQTRPGSVVDAGSNRGWYAQLACRLGSRVVGFDIDEICVDQLYLDAKKEDLNILPLVMSFHKPTPGYGLGQWFPPAIDRFRSEIVLGLALVHHLVFKGNLRFEHIAAGLSAFTTRWLLVEFIPKEDQYVCKWDHASRPWYDLEQFKTALSRHFRRIETLPSDPHPRLMLLCEK